MSDVLIYTKTGCPYCQKVKQDYKDKGINYKEINITVDAAARQSVKENFGAEMVPVIVQDGKLVSIGYNGGG